LSTPTLYSMVYLGPLAYYTRALRESVLHWEAWERFPKQSYRNRAYISGPNGLQMLSIPVSCEQTTLVNQVRISYSEDWVKNHLKALETAYGNAPFFDPIYGGLKTILESRYSLLWELNTEIHHWILSCLRSELPILPTTEFIAPLTNERTGKDHRFHIHPKKEDTLRDGLTPYNQPFDRAFSPEVSILDLLFMEGAWGLDYLDENWKRYTAHGGK